MEKSIGGDRLGSGKKMKVYLHNYERSTHDLGNVFRSTMAPGVLVPFYKKVALNGDTWTIDLNTLVRTTPAIGPLFGSYKLQMDVFEIPMRLYNGVLHNNWTKIGMDMSKVKLPKMSLSTTWNDPSKMAYDDYNTDQISSSSLLAYLGVRGIGGVRNGHQGDVIERDFNAIPVLAYYDIFKNYYSNKQEKKAYVIGVKNTNTQVGEITMAYYQSPSTSGQENNFIPMVMQNRPTTTAEQTAWMGYKIIDEVVNWGQVTPLGIFTNNYRIFNGSTIKIDYTGELAMITYTNSVTILFEDPNDSTNVYTSPLADPNVWDIMQQNNGAIVAKAKMDLSNYVIRGILYDTVSNETGEIELKSYDLENIDRMRMEILKATGLNVEFNLRDYNVAPYREVISNTSGGYNQSRYEMVGLCLKTYQSDIFNNWLSSEWIDGMNGIAAVTSVDTSQGYFTIDTLSLAHKVYNMLNRIAISGGTYQDWQEAVYGEDAVRMAESPIYCGGMSGVVAFEEVVSTADTDTAAAGDQPLGSLAGKGILTNVKGGHIEIHIKEPSYIMGIVSITPYLDYNQGNDFDMTELDSINDLHKPALDQIGYENLMLERACWWGKEYDANDLTWKDNAVGKLPAWINYMTSVNQVYGDFAKKTNLGFMVLTRGYEVGTGTIQGDTQTQSVPVKDWTTYINPTKFNYQFADKRLSAQNFWVQIGINAIARRKMSAKIMPNL